MLDAFNYFFTVGEGTPQGYWTRVEASAVDETAVLSGGASGYLSFHGNVPLQINDKVYFDDMVFQVKTIERMYDRTRCLVCPDPSIYLRASP